MYYLFIMRQVICWFVYIGNWFVYIGKNPWFTAFLDSNLHTRLAIVTKNELGLAFPLRNLPKKFRQDPSTFYLVIVVTNKQTDRQTNAGKNIIPRFRRDNNNNKVPCATAAGSNLMRTTVNHMRLLICRCLLHNLTSNLSFFQHYST